jgi:hypothetical protein
LTADAEERGAVLHAGVKIPLNFAQRCQYEIAEAVTTDVTVARKAEIEEGQDARICVGQRQQAVSNIAGWRYLVTAAQTPRAPTVVGHRHDGREKAGVGRRVDGWRGEIGAFEA